MLESGLFFVLGFLCAALLALIIAPAIWRRAEVLTRLRIERSVPLTMNEIQADKDQLRAEFAMSNRRLEMKLETAQERASNQLIELNKNREELRSLEEEATELSRQVEDQEMRETQRRNALKEREDQLNTTSTDLSTIGLKLDDKTIAYDELQQKFRTTVDEFNARRIDMAAREGRLDIIEDEAREAKKLSKQLTAERSELRKQLKTSVAALSKERSRVSKRDDKLERLQASQADMEGRLERRDADIARLRSKQSSPDQLALAMQETIDELNIEMSRLESEMNRSAARMKVMLKVELTSLLAAAGADLPDGDPNNDVMRERIKDLAAKVTAVTASIEGPESPIFKAIGEQPGSKKRTSAGRKPNEKTLQDLSSRILAFQPDSEPA